MIQLTKKINSSTILDNNKQVIDGELYTIDLNKGTKAIENEKFNRKALTLAHSKQFLDDRDYTESNEDYDLIVKESNTGKVYVERISEVNGVKTNTNEQRKFIQDGARLVSHNDVNVKFEMENAVEYAELRKLRNYQKRLARKLKRNNK